MPVLTRKNELTNGKRNMRLGLQPSITKAVLINTMFLFPAQKGTISFFTQAGLLLLIKHFRASKAVIM